MGKLFDDLMKHSENTLQEELNKEWEEIKPLNAIEYANWIEGYKSKIESKYFELFKKARQEDKQKLIAEACRWLEDVDFEMTYIDGDGFFDTEKFIIDITKAMEDLK